MDETPKEPVLRSLTHTLPEETNPEANLANNPENSLENQTKFIPGMVADVINLSETLKLGVLSLLKSLGGDYKNIPEESDIQTILDFVMKNHFATFGSYFVVDESIIKQTNPQDWRFFLRALKRERIPTDFEIRVKSPKFWQSIFSTTVKFEDWVRSLPESATFNPQAAPTPQTNQPVPSATPILSPQKPAKNSGSSGFQQIESPNVISMENFRFQELLNFFESFGIKFTTIDINFSETDINLDYFLQKPLETLETLKEFLQDNHIPHGTLDDSHKHHWLFLYGLFSQYEIDLNFRMNIQKEKGSKIFPEKYFGPLIEELAGGVIGLKKNQ